VQFGITGVETHDAQATPTRTTVRHYRSILKVNVARCVAARNVTRLARLRKFFHLSFFVKFFENLRTDMLLPILNLFFKKKAI